MWRATLMIHRYLGVAVGILMLMWFASGIVMIYVPYPQLSPAQHLQALPPVPMNGCCTPGAIGLANDDPVLAMQIEAVLGKAVMRTRASGHPPGQADLSDGRPIAVDAGSARAIALDAATRIAKGATQIRSTDIIDRDQWTVAEDYDFDRPLYRFAFNDGMSTDVYVSGSSGAIVLWTTGAERFWNWFGAVPHWLYFTRLRSNGPLWSKIVIWTSIAGAFLTTFGLYLGYTSVRRGPRFSPYRGWTWWHHLGGLGFGVFALTWVVSGTISMNPWGFLEGRGGNERARLAGDPLPYRVYRDSLTTIGANRQLAGMVSLTSAPQAGKLYWVAHWPDGRILRLDASGQVGQPGPADLAREAELLAQGRRIGSRELLTREDDYFYSGANGGRVVLPVYRVILADADHTRYYLDPRTGGLLGRIDQDRRSYRWLFDGLHRLDFLAWIRVRPLWDFVMLSLLAGGIVVTGTGSYLALSRVRRDLAAAKRAAFAYLRRLIPPAGARGR